MSGQNGIAEKHRALDAAAIDELFARSAEQDTWQRRLLAAERAGYARGRADGYAEGWTAAEDDMAASWRAFAAPVSRGRSPVCEGWERRVAAAIAETRRTAGKHWREFVRRAGAS